MDCTPPVPPFPVGPHGVHPDDEPLFTSATLNGSGELYAKALALSSAFDSTSIRRAGRLILAPIVNASGGLKDYITNARDRLNVATAAFIEKHIDALQVVLDEMHEANYAHHDILSASTMKYKYLLRNQYRGFPVESPVQMYMRIAVALHGAYAKPKAIDDDAFDARTVATVIRVFREMATRQYTPATPTLSNLGTTRQQGASCFVFTVSDDINGMYDTLRDIAFCTKSQGGIGLSVSFLRSGQIKGGGHASGPVPYMAQLDKLLSAIDQSGSRAGAGNVYCDVSHYHIIQFIMTTGPKVPVSERLRLATTVLMHDLFFQRLKNGETWTLFCPAKTAHLLNLFGADFELEYKRLESLAIKNRDAHRAAKTRHATAIANAAANPSSETHRAERTAAELELNLASDSLILFHQINPSEIMAALTETQRVSGYPCVVNADSMNAGNMAPNVGPINTGNLCVEISLPTSMGVVAQEVKRDIANDVAVNPKLLPAVAALSNHRSQIDVGTAISVCNLASLSLKKHADLMALEYRPSCLLKSDIHDPDQLADAIRGLVPDYNFKALCASARSAVINVNRVVDNSFSPVPDKAGAMNEAMRPIGIGVSGLGDAVVILRSPLDGLVGDALSIATAAAIQFNALAESVNLAIDEGPYYMFRRGSFTITRNPNDPPSFVPLRPPTRVEQHGLRPDELVNETYSGSPASNGFLQSDLVAIKSGVRRTLGHQPEDVYPKHFDIPIDPALWGQTEIVLCNGDVIAPTWQSLREAVVRHGTRNSHVTAYMPTASTGQLLNNTETTEAPPAWISKKSLDIGDFTTIPEVLRIDLTRFGLYDQATIDFLVTSNGSLRDFPAWTRRFRSAEVLSAIDQDWLDSIPQIYKTMYECSIRSVMLQACRRMLYIDQMQSSNIFIATPNTDSQLAGIQRYAYMLGLKTASYYIRQQPAITAGSTFSISTSSSSSAMHTSSFVKAVGGDAAVHPPHVPEVFPRADLLNPPERVGGVPQPQLCEACGS